MRQHRRRWRLAALLSLAILPGCATMMVTGGVECEVFSPIYWSVEDTDETIAQAKAHNAARLAWGCPK